MEAPFTHVNVQEDLDMGTKGDSQSLMESITTSKNSKFLLDSTLAEYDWEHVCKVRVEENISLEKVMEIVDEDSMSVQIQTPRYAFSDP